MRWGWSSYALLLRDFTSRHARRSGGEKRNADSMSGTDEWIERLIAAGCMPKVAASVVTEVFVAGVQSAVIDKAAEKRREWDREYRRKRNAKRPPESGGNRVESDALHLLWTEGVGLLRQLGVKERPARSNVGLWLKTQKPELVLERIRQAHRARVGDPIPWITRSFGVKNGKHESPVASAFDDLIARAEGGAGQDSLDDPDDLTVGRA